MSKIKSQGGFTLIELLIVVLIIGILAAIAIPVFNGQRAKAKNSGAKSSLRNAQTAASSIRTINDTFATDAADVREGLEGEEEALNFVAGAPADEPGTGAANKNETVYVQRAATVGGVADTPGIVLTVVSTGDKAYSAAQTDEGSAWVTNDDGDDSAADSIDAVATVAPSP